jgi:hypothetical protein
VTMDNDDVGTLTGTKEVETGESNEKSDSPVPATVATLAKTDFTSNSNCDICSETEVAELHDVVTNMVVEEMQKDDVGSRPAKFIPRTVTELRPEGTPFRSASDTSTASKLNMGADVPATPPTLTADSPNMLLIELLRQESVVADVHDDVPHATISKALVAVNSPTPKSSPETVKELPPLQALLRRTAEATAASNDKMPAFVPLRTPTVTCMLP